MFVWQMHFFLMSKRFKWNSINLNVKCCTFDIAEGNAHTSMMKSVYGFMQSCLSCPLTRSRLYLTRKRPKFFSSLDSFSRRSSFSTSSWLRKRATRIVMGLGEQSWAFCQICFIPSTLPSAGRPARKYTASLNMYNIQEYSALLLHYHFYAPQKKKSKLTLIQKCKAC